MDKEQVIKDLYGEYPKCSFYSDTDGVCILLADFRTCYSLNKDNCQLRKLWIDKPEEKEKIINYIKEVHKVHMELMKAMRNAKN